MNLFFYSDHIIPANRKIDELLLARLVKRNPSVVWIPAGNSIDRVDSFFASRRKAYSELGIKNVTMLKVHEPLTKEYDNLIMNCDILHLSGGNPYVFAENLRRHSLFEVIRKRAKGGGFIVGDSAGAMIVTPSIKICDFDSSSLPPMKFDHETIGLVDFEINPHWGQYGANEKQIVEYSEDKNITVYCVPDGAGIVVTGSKIEFIGPIIEVKNGKVNKLL